jgi:hypothetical protein
VHELETAALLSGIPYWRIDKEPALGPQEPEALTDAPDRVVATIINAKRARVDLSEDMAAIANRLFKLNDFLKTSNQDQLKLPFLLNLLKLQHQGSYLHFLGGLEQALDLYLDHKSDANFSKI